MTNPIGNKSQLYATIDHKKVTIIKGKLTQKINQSYTGEFTLTTDGKLNAEDMMGKKIMISMDANHETQYVHGLVTQSTASAGANSTYRITMESLLFILRKRHQSRSFTDTSVKSVINEILSENAFHRTDVTFKLKDDGEHPYFEQHQTTDLAFFQRVLAEEGLTYYFIPNEDSVSICIDDQSEKTSKHPVAIYPFIPGLIGNLSTFKINKFEQSHRPPLSGIQLHGYDSQMPSMSMQTDAQTPSLSFMEMKPSTVDQLKKTQQNRLDAFNADADRATLICNIPSLIPGMIFAMSQHPETSFNRHYRVTESVQTWDETGADLHYQNEVNVVPITVATRPAYIPTEQTIPHLSLATVKGEGARAKLTEKGEYYVQPIDMAASETPHAPVRQAQSFVGNGYGMHFPLLDNTEVVMARVNGHPDKPVILGALYNESNMNPVSGRNPYLNVIKTQAGNAMTMNDTPHSRSISLHTAEQENQFILDAKASAPDIHLTSVVGGFSLQAAGASSWWTQGNAALIADEKMVLTANAMDIATNKESISMKSAENLTVSAKEFLLNVTETVTSTIHGGFWHTVTEDHDLICDGKFALMADEGSVHIQSTHDRIALLAEAGKISLEVGEAMVEFDESGNCVMRAQKITLHAAEINMQNAGSVSVA
ncbi:MAG: type VI secretion system Vgr family protein [Gammaproteobacteria bacterium]